MWSPCIPWAHWSHMAGYILNVISICPLGTLYSHNWVHFECIQLLPTGHIVITYWLDSQCIQRVPTDYWGPCPPVYQDRLQHRWFSVEKPCIFLTIILSCDRSRAQSRFREEFLRTLMDLRWLILSWPSTWLMMRRMPWSVPWWATGLILQSWRGCRLRWSCLGLNPYTIELVFHLVLKWVARCSINVVLATYWVQYTHFRFICEQSKQAKWFETSGVGLIR